MKPQYNFFANTTFALKGLKFMLQNEKSFRIEFVLCVPLMIISLFVPCSLLEHLLLLAVMIFIFFAEALNTAIEATIDLLSPDFHPLAGAAKDCASFGVFCSISLAVLCWCVILFESFKQYLGF